LAYEKRPDAPDYGLTSTAVPAPMTDYDNTKNLAAFRLAGAFHS
jgi:hypothetical protein